MNVNRRTALKVFGAAGAALALPAIPAWASVPDQPTHLLLTIGAVPGERKLDPSSRIDPLGILEPIPYEIHAFPVASSSIQRQGFVQSLFEISVAALQQYPKSPLRQHAPMSAMRIVTKGINPGVRVSIPFISPFQVQRPTSDKLGPIPVRSAPKQHPDNEIAVVYLTYENGWNLILRKRTVGDLYGETHASAYRTPKLILWDFDKREEFLQVEPKSEDGYVAVTHKGVRSITQV